MMLRTVALVLSLCAVPPMVVAQTYSDKDWNWKGKPNCKFPAGDSVRWLSEGDRKFLRFQLRDGDVGNCSTDNDPSHSKKFNKPWSERAEIKGNAFRQSGVYRITFDVRFVQGFDQDRLSSTFFQIKDCPDSRVPVMAMLGGWKKRTGGRTKVGVGLASGTQDKQWKSKFLGLDPVDNKWHKIEAIFENGSKHALSVKFDGATWLSRTEFRNAFLCGKPSFRIGIYRAGDPGRNAHSIVDYDKVSIEKIE